MREAEREHISQIITSQNYDQQRSVEEMVALTAERGWYRNQEQTAANYLKAIDGFARNLDASFKKQATNHEKTIAKAAADFTILVDKQTAAEEHQK